MIDFTELNVMALSRSSSWLSEIAPDGEIKGKEYVAGTKHGGAGGSFSFNLLTGKWADFATDEKGGDPVSLVASAKNLSRGEAAKWLLDRLGISKDGPVKVKNVKAKTTWSTTPAKQVPGPIRHPTHGVPTSIYTYRNQNGALLGYVCRFDHKDGKKEILPYTHGRDQQGKERFRWKHFSHPRPLYMLDRLIAQPEAPVLVVEGEKCADTGNRQVPGCITTTWSGGAGAVSQTDWSHMKGRRVAVWPDNDEAGRKAANEVVQKCLQAGALQVFLIEIPPEKPEKWDLADAEEEGLTKEMIAAWIRLQSREVKLATTEQSANLQEDMPKPNTDTGHDSSAILSKLAALSDLEYEKVRKVEAESLGIRTSALDKAVKAEKENVNVRELPFKEVALYRRPIDPAELLTAIEQTVRRFIVCNEDIAKTVALWTSMTWFMDVVQVAPLAIITAPEKRCGKTQLLSLLAKLSRRPIMASNISPAALFRAIDAWNPTLLIDEADACLRDNEELRGIINAGHTRDSAYVIRTIGDAFTPTMFQTWGAKAISGIGHVAETLMDRAVILELRRKLPNEKIERLRYADPDLFPTLASKLARFANDYREQVRQARPALPESLNDRQQDNWEPLLAIASMAGLEWLENAAQAALKISGIESLTQSIGTELLADIQEIFESKHIERISITGLIEALTNDEEKTWAAYNRGKPIRTRQVSKKLKEYGIASKPIRFVSGVQKGFEKAQFNEAFHRYLSVTPVSSATWLQTNNTKHLNVTKQNSRYSRVTEENDNKIMDSLTCKHVTEQAPPPEKNTKKYEVRI